MSKRLTNQLKDRILDNAIRKAGIPKRREEYLVELAALAEKVRVDALGGAEAAKKIERAAKRLLEEWPEVAELLPKDVEQKTNLPAVRLDVLNDKLGLSH